MTEYEKAELKIKKLAVLASLVTPVAVVLVGLWVQLIVNAQEKSRNDLFADQERRWKEAESERERIWRSSERINISKQELYASLGADLNRIYAYCQDVGDYRKYTPIEIVDLKRKCDRTFHMYKAMWSEPVVDAYQKFMESAFDTNNGPGKRAVIRAAMSQKKAAYKIDKLIWDPEWNGLFSDEKNTGMPLVYQKMVAAFMKDHVTNFEVRVVEDTD